MKPVNKTIPFENTAIHVIPDRDEAVTMVSLQDLCRILKRMDMIQNGKAMELCTSSTRYPVYTNGKLFWFIAISDVFVLLKHVRKENKVVAKTCDKIEKWVANLPIGRLTRPVEKEIEKPQKIACKNNGDSCLQLQKLEELDGGALAFDFNGKRYRNATEMGRKSGENPRKWLLKAETQKIRVALVEQGKSESLESQVITKRGQQGGTFLADELATYYERSLNTVMSPSESRSVDTHVNNKIIIPDHKESWPIPDQSDPPVEKSLELQFNHLVNNSQFDLPQTRSAALMLAAELAGQIERDRPKVEYYNKMIESRNHFTTYFIASELDVSVVKLYKFLVNERIVKYEKKQYTVYSSHQALQCEIDYLFTFKNGKTYPCGKGKRWTKAGREYIIDLYKQKNPQKILVIE